MSQPLVSVICLCYNHAKYIGDCIDSVLNQTYKNIEIIIVDDASTDGSKTIISEIISSHPEIKFIDLKDNLGNCKAFNTGLAHSTGSYIVDLATDDMFTPERIEKQVALFEKLPNDYGVIHTNAAYIDEDENQLRDHYYYLQRKGLLKEMPQGDVYQSIISKFFVSAPTMLVKKEVFIELNGYDESLTYEDFDFWVRSARNWKYAFIDEQLTKIRKVSGSKSSKWHSKGDKQLYSTYLVCKKIQQLNQTPAENKSLIKRLKYELRHALFTNNSHEFKLFYKMLKDNNAAGLIEMIMCFINKLGIPLRPVRNVYHLLRYG